LPFVAGAILSAQAARADVFADLDKRFVLAYKFAAKRNLAVLCDRVPVIVNRFEQIALCRPKVETPEIFAMDTDAYMDGRLAYRRCHVRETRAVRRRTAWGGA